MLVGPKDSETALSVTDLHVKFSIKKTSKKSPNNASVSIWNLTDNTRSQISTTEDIVIVKAGYETDRLPEVIYKGDVTNITTSLQPPDVVTTIESSDGVKAISDTNISLSIDSGASAKSILDRVVKAFPIARKVLPAVGVPDKKYASGFSSFGRAEEILSRITDDLGLEWSIQDNELKIIEADKSDGTRVVHLSSSTGLIGSPIKKNDILKATKKSGQKKDTPGWSVKTLLVPFLEPGGRVSIESAEIKAGSIFRVQTVEHSGDTHGNDWYTTLEVTEL